MKLSGVIHMHSTHSYDGKVPLNELKKLLFKRGLSFCCVTEHTDEMTPEGARDFVLECEQYSDQAFVFIPGFEVPYKDAHVLHIGTTNFLGQIADEDTLRQWKDQTALVVLAHPVRNRFEVDETLLEVIDGVEVWNQQYEGKSAPRFRSLKLLKKLQLSKPELMATGGLDFHRREHLGWPEVEIETDKVDQEEIISQLRHGFYKIKGRGVILDSHGQFVKGGSVLTRLSSLLSILVIKIGKTINTILASLGIRLPKKLISFFRSRV